MIGKFFDIKPDMLALDKEVMEICKPYFEKVDEVASYNQMKVLKAFIDNGISATHLVGTTGYGYDDRGRDGLDRLFADIMGAEDALCRYNFMSGTHTLTVALFGVLRTGDTIFCATGTPYDTLHGVIGIDGSHYGNLMDYGVKYDQCDLLPGSEPDLETIREKCRTAKVCYIQRSRGYAKRKALSLETIKAISDAARTHNPEIIVMVDNCYGEYTHTEEPLAYGADLIMGSLIKNPGGGIAPTGGYIAGRKDLVELCSYRMTTPGVGREVGATLGNNRDIFMGLFNAPHVTGEALKVAAFTAALFEEMGYEVSPGSDEVRADIIQSIKLGNREKLVAFCQGLQSGSVIDSYVVPEPWAMPGYDSDVIMAAGAFTNGSSIELSADAPLREPFAVWLQGGLNFHSAKIGVLLGAQRVLDLG